MRAGFHTGFSAAFPGKHLILSEEQEGMSGSKCPNDRPCREMSLLDRCVGFWAAGVETGSGSLMDFSFGVGEVGAEFQSGPVFEGPIDG